jgi:hypothetical protein
MQELQIDLTFQDFLRPLTSVEYKVLEDNILKYGIRDSIVVWKNHNTIIDGHNRYSICQKNNIDFNIVQLDFETEDDIISWMIENQDGRRNETLEMKYKKIDRYLLKYPEKPSSTVAKRLRVSIPTVIKRRNLMTLIFPEGSTTVDSRGRIIPLRKKSKDSTKKKVIVNEEEKDQLIAKIQQDLRDKEELIAYLNNHIMELQVENHALTVKLERTDRERQQPQYDTDNKNIAHQQEEVEKDDEQQKLCEEREPRVNPEVVMKHTMEKAPHWNKLTDEDKAEIIKNCEWIDPTSLRMSWKRGMIALVCENKECYYLETEHKSANRTLLDEKIQTCPICGKNQYE